MSSGTQPSCSVTQKPLALLLYQATEDKAFNLSDAHAQSRIKELSKYYELSFKKINTLLEAKQFAQKTLGNSNRKFAHLEFAGHGTQTELIFNKSVSGGIISPNIVEGREELKELIEMVDPNGIIVSQSCCNGSTILNGMNVLEYITGFTTPGQRVVGASDLVNMFHMISIRHFHLIKSIKNRCDENITTIYLKTINHQIQKIDIDCVDFLYEHIFNRNPDKADLCYELMANSSDPVKSQELIARHCPDLSEKLSEYFLSLQIKNREGTKWTPIFDDLERVSRELGWNEDPRLELTQKQRSFTPVANLGRIPTGEHQTTELYQDTYEFLLALSELDHYYDLLRLLDNEKGYNLNPACLPLYRLTRHVWHPNLQPLGYVRHNLEIIKRLYPLIKTQGDPNLVDWFKQAFKGGCFEEKLNATYTFCSASGVIEIDPIFNIHALFIDDTLSQVVQKSYSALLTKIYWELKINKDPSPEDSKYPLFELLRCAPALLRFTKSQLEKYQVPTDKFSDEEILHEIRLAETCEPDEKIPDLLTHVVKTDFQSLIRLKDLIYLSPDDLLIQYPVEAANFLKALNFTADAAIKFCIDHQLENVNLCAYDKAITVEMLDELFKNNQGMRELVITLDPKVYSVTENYDFYTLFNGGYIVKYSYYGILRDDCLRTVIEKTHFALQAKNRRILGFEHHFILPSNDNNIILKIMGCQSEMLRFTRTQLEKYHIPADKFSDEELLSEIELQGLIEDKDIPGLLLDLAKRNFYILFHRGKHIHLTPEDLLLRYPVQCAPRLTILGLTIQQAIAYCIAHQIEVVDLKDYNNEISSLLLWELAKKNKGMRSLDLSNCITISDEEIAKMAEKYPRLTILKPPKIRIQLRNIRAEILNLSIIDDSHWIVLGIPAVNVPFVYDIPAMQAIVNKLQNRVKRQMGYAATLMLMPKGLTLSMLNKIIGIRGCSAFIKSAWDVPNTESYWVLISNDILIDSRKKSFKEQLQQLEELKGRLPNFLEVAALSALSKTFQKMQLFNNSPQTHTRLSDQFKGFQGAFGGFDGKRAYLNFRDCVDIEHGVAFATRLRTESQSRGRQIAQSSTN